MAALDPRFAAVASSNHGLVTARVVAEAGLPRAALRWAVNCGLLVRIGHGCYVETARWGAADARARHVLRLRAALARTRAGVAAAESAAVLHGLPLPEVPLKVRVVIPVASGRKPFGGNGSGSAQVIRRRAEVDLDEVAIRAGIRVTTPARTVVDCARHLDLPWALALADAARRTLSVSRTRLRLAAAHRPVAPGHDRALWVCEHAVTKAESRCI